MNLLEIIGIALIGLFLGNLLFASVARWLGSVYVIAKDGTRAGARAKGWKIAAVTFLGSGLWMLVVLTFFFYHVRSSAWGVWLVAGTLASIVFFSGFALLIARKIARESSMLPNSSSSGREEA